MKELKDGWYVVRILDDKSVPGKWTLHAIKVQCGLVVKQKTIRDGLYVMPDMLSWDEDHLLRWADHMCVTTLPPGKIVDRATTKKVTIWHECRRLFQVVELFEEDNHHLTDSLVAIRSSDSVLSEEDWSVEVLRISNREVVSQTTLHAGCVAPPNMVGWVASRVFRWAQYECPESERVQEYHDAVVLLHDQEHLD